MTLDSFAAFSYSHAGKHDRKPYALARFTSHDGTRLNRRVPSPQHVARNLAAPALTGTNPANVPALLCKLLAAMPLRTSNGRGGNVSDHYLGLYAALHWNASADFDRDAYVAAITDATLAELRRKGQRAARTPPRATRRSQGPAASPPTLAPAEVKARFHTARETRERDYARASVLEFLDLNEVQDGDIVTRAELVDAVLGDLGRARHVLTCLREDNDAAQRKHAEATAAYTAALAEWDTRKSMQPALSIRTRPQKPARPAPTRWETRAAEHGFPPSTPPSFGARRAASLVIELAAELGLIESRSGNVRRYVYTPPNASTSEDPTIDANTIREQAAAYRDLADAIRDVTAAETTRFDAQRALYLSGDRLGALHAHAERHELAPVPDNVIAFPPLVPSGIGPHALTSSAPSPPNPKGTL